MVVEVCMIIGFIVGSILGCLGVNLALWHRTTLKLRGNDDMKRFLAVVATTNKVEDSWGGTSEFTLNALNQLASSAKGKPVLLDFDNDYQIGVVESAYVADNKLFTVFNLYLDMVKYSANFRLVPSFTVELDEWKEGDNIHRIIDNVTMISCGLTIDPIETDLPEIERL